MNKELNSASLTGRISKYLTPYRSPHPDAIQIEVTNLCNLKCRTCGRNNFLSKFGSMPLNAYEDLLEKIKLKQIQKFHFGGYGEPLLNKNLIDMIKKIPPGIYTSTNTNLSLHDEKTITALATSGLSEINVSLDGFDQSTYESVRIGADWKLVVRNIETINRNKRSDLNLHLHSVVYEINLDSYLNNFSHLVHDLDVDRVIFVGMKSHGNNDAVSSKQRFFGRREKDTIKSIAEKYGIEVIFKNNASMDKCFRPYNEMYILFDGSVTPCCNIVDDSFYSFGNLLKSNSLNDVWNSKQAIAFRKKLATGRPFHLCKKICGLKK